MKKYFLAFFVLLVTTIVHAQKEIETIQLDPAQSLVTLGISKKYAIEARIIRTPYSPESKYTKMEIEIDVVLEWPGCGWFSEDSTILISRAENNFGFHTLTKAQAYSCQSTTKGYRLFTYRFIPIESSTFTLAKSVKVESVFIPHPKGNNFRPTFARIEITDGNGDVITLTEN